MTAVPHVSQSQALIIGKSAQKLEDFMPIATDWLVAALLAGIPMDITTHIPHMFKPKAYVFEK